MESWKEELYHHGIKGQKWGVRRYQNEDGTLTEAGRKRVSKRSAHDADTIKKGLSEKQKRALIVGGLAVAGTALAAYGAYKYSDYIKDKAVQDIISRGRTQALKSLVAGEVPTGNWTNDYKKLGYSSPMEAKSKRTNWYKMNEEKSYDSAKKAYTDALAKSKDISKSYSSSKDYLKNRPKAITDEAAKEAWLKRHRERWRNYDITRNHDNFINSLLYEINK